MKQNHTAETKKEKKDKKEKEEKAKSKSRNLFVTVKNIEDWEGCCNTTAKAHYEQYVVAFGKMRTAELSILEYAALKEIEPAEIFLRLGINLTIYDADQLELCMIRVRRKLEMARKVNSK
jgi:hypothetical protein